MDRIKLLKLTQTIVWLFSGHYLLHSRPRGRALFGQHKESRPLGSSYFRNMRSVIVSYSRPIRFVRLDSEHAQSDRNSENRDFPVVDLPRGQDAWCWTIGGRPLETTIYLLRPEKSGKRRDWMTPCVSVAAHSVQSVQEYRFLGWMKEVGRESVVLLQNTTHWG